MLLSIVMMIKDEEKFLEETLKSLMPLMNDIDSELIILDTGSSDNSVNIARKYTNKVYFSEWNNNFAEMRNKSISYAKGEWILILDADEKLICYEKLKEFFKNNLDKKYNSANIRLKNIQSEDEKIYTYIFLTRLFKKDNDFKYIGAIHEQPLFKAPIYGNIAEFNHYGYLYIDEELRQKKSKRNKKILFDELMKKTNDPYINYQLAKECIISNNLEEAFYYTKKSYKLYEKTNNIPIFASIELINLYNLFKKYSDSEKLCNKYIKEDDKNIDVYFYLAIAQMGLSKYKEAIKSLKRYKYLVDNYDLTTQSIRIDCEARSVTKIKEYEILLITSYYKLEKYDEVVSMIDKISEEALDSLYLIIINSLYKSSNTKKILNLYNKLSTEIQKNKFKVELEVFLNNAKDDDKKYIYELLSNIEDNYGILNKVRLNDIVSLELYNKILNVENELYYGDLLYYVLDNYDYFIKILGHLDYLKIYNYLSYLVKNRKESIFKLYNILINKIMSLNLNSIKINAAASKVLLFNGGLMGEKYKNVFYIYLTYQYERIRYYYNDNISDYEILDVVNDEESKFILKFNIIKKLKEDNKLEYIKELKRLLVENQCYKKGLDLIIEEFKREFNQNDELKELKKKFISIIEEKLNNGKYDVCHELIRQYEEIHGEDDLYNIKAILKICEGDILEVDKLLKLAYCFNKNDEDVLFNIAYIRESQGNIEEAIVFYEKILEINPSEDIINKIDELKNRI